MTRAVDVASLPPTIVQSGDNVGIGTSTPSYKLDVRGGSAAVINAGSNASVYVGEGLGTSEYGEINWNATSNLFNFTTTGTGIITFATNTTERMRINASGNVGIGTSNPFDKLGIGVSANSQITVYEYLGVPSITAYTNAGASKEFRLSGAPLTFSGNGGAGAEQMRLDSSGNLGIGTTSPSGALGLYRGSTASCLIEIAGNGNTPGSTSLAVGQDGGSSGYLWNRANSVLLFGTNNTERARITSTGQLLIGTTTAYTGVGMTLTPSGEMKSTVAVTTYANHHIFANPNGDRGAIYTDGVNTVYANFSDYRLKENIQPMQNALAKVAALNPVTWNWKLNGSNGQGFIAHELQKVIPDAVVGEKDAVDAEGNPIHQAVDTSFLVATLTKAIQELTAKVESLEKEISVLKSI